MIWPGGSSPRHRLRITATAAGWSQKAASREAAELALYERELRNIRVVERKSVLQLEITAPRDKPRWNQGTMSNFAAPRAVIQDSDAHAPNELSRRPTFYRLSDVKLNDLRTAFKDHEDKVRFPHELFGPEPEIKGALQ